VPWLIEGLQWKGMTMIRNLIMASRVPNQFPIKSYPIGSMVLVYIYANIWGLLMGSMLAYIAAPWILWVSNPCKFSQIHWNPLDIFW
jgi:hypothetical protein